MEALKKQTRPANEIIITVRDIDTDTWTFLETHEFDLPLRTVTVRVTGVVAAMNAGFDIAQGEIISTTDDDAAPHPDWLERIEAYFVQDNHLGGVGGRDWQYIGTEIKEPGERQIVGKLQWFGRVIGNHHLAVGEPREVDVLKGVNMSFRRIAIKGLRFDQRMRGTGAQVHFELAFSLAVRRRGWKIIFDPQLGVDHYPAQRFDEDQRDNFNDIAWSNAVHNETIALLEHFAPLQRIILINWSLLVGTREALGLIQLLRLLPSEKELALKKWFASVQGRWQGWQTWQTYRSIRKSERAIEV